MDKPFRYLRDAEWQALATRAGRRTFPAGEVILQEGARATGILVVARGSVKVCRVHGEFRIEIGECSAGEIFGEMSFIEDEPAAVTLVAGIDVEVLLIRRAEVQALINENPGFFGRFFQSLAWILSQRLRATTGQLAASQDSDVWREH